MMTVVDQHKPWLTPSSTLAHTIQPQLGAQMMSSGTGSPASQPATRSGLRPIRSASCPVKRLASALTMPKLTRKERTTVFDTSPKSAWGMSGTTVRSSPTMAPTKALTTTRRANWRQLAPRPSRMAGVVSGNGAAIGARFQLGGIAVRKRAGFVQCDDPVMVRWCRRDPGEHVAHERLLGLAQERDAFPDCPERRANGPAVERHRLARMSGQDDGLERQCDQALQGRVEQVSPAARLLGRRLEVRTADSRREQGVPREEGAFVQEVADALRGVTRRVHHLEGGGSHAHDVAIAQGRVLEGHPIGLRQVQRAPGVTGQRPGAGQVVGMHVGLHYRTDLPALTAGQLAVDPGVERGVDHGGLAARANDVGETALP